MHNLVIRVMREGEKDLILYQIIRELLIIENININK